MWHAPDQLSQQALYMLSRLKGIETLPGQV